QEAGSAVLFIDAPILCNCDIIDLPGFETQNERDDKITINITERADAIIYLSQANGFMRIEDINDLKCNINTLPAWERRNENDLKPLSNLFIVASQAHNVTNGNRKELKEILDHGCHALQNSLQDDFWCERMKVSGYDADSYDEDSLRKRFFTYTTDIPDLCENFYASLREITEQLSLLVEQKIRFFAMQYVKDRNPALYAEISKYEEILSMREKYIFLLSEIDANEGKRAEENYQRKVEINDLIETLRKDSITEFSDFCASNFMPNAIVDLLKNREVKNTTEDVGQFTSWFQGHIQSHCDEILQKKSKELTDKTEDYIQKFNDSISAAFQANHVNASKFDAGWAFMSALAKFGVFGGLGGLLAGTGVIAFGSLSLLLGGAGTAAVVACGLGPIGVAVGGVMLLAMGLMSLVSGGWKKSVAKEISKDLEKRNVAEQYRTVMKNYWKQTLDAFNHAADTLDEEWQNYVGQLRDAVSEDNGETNSNALQELHV
ncbi:MAG: Dynamin family protein, partial [Christensenellaceae bacterium]